MWLFFLIGGNAMQTYLKLQIIINNKKISEKLKNVYDKLFSHKRNLIFVFK